MWESWSVCLEAGSRRSPPLRGGGGGPPHKLAKETWGGHALPARRPGESAGLQLLFAGRGAVGARHFLRFPCKQRRIEGCGRCILCCVYVLSTRNPSPHVAQAVPSWSFKC